MPLRERAIHAPKRPPDMGEERQVKKTRVCAISFKECWQDGNGRWCSNGGFPLQMAGIASLFDSMTLLVTFGETPGGGSIPLPGNAEIVLIRRPVGRDPWRKFFEEAGYSTVAPGWPDDPETVQEGNANPGRFAGKTVGQIAAHLESTIGRLTMPPVVIGHSFGGLLVQILAGRGLAKATVAIGTLIVILALVAAFVGWQLLKRRRYGGQVAEIFRVIPPSRLRCRGRRIQRVWRRPLRLAGRSS